MVKYLSILYLCEQNTKISKRGHRLLVEKDDQSILDIPIRKVERIFIFGNIQITTQAMSILLEEQVEVAFFSLRGRFKGSLSGPMSKNISLRIAQYECWHDETVKLHMGRQFIQSKMLNMINVLQRYSYNHPEADFKKQIDIIRHSITRLSETSSIDEIMGIEGYGSRVYFGCFAQMCRRELIFPGRYKHPSSDPINALLSLGYTLVGSEIAALLEAMSLDPYLGFLHSVRYGRQSLALDLLEEFRQAIIDPFTLKLINKKIFSEKDFELAEGGGMQLIDRAFRRYIDHYEDRLNRASVKGPDGKLSWREVMQIQTRELGHAIQEKRPYRAHNFV